MEENEMKQYNPDYSPIIYYDIVAVNDLDEMETIERISHEQKAITTLEAYRFLNKQVNYFIIRITEQVMAW